MIVNKGFWSRNHEKHELPGSRQTAKMEPRMTGPVSPPGLPRLEVGRDVVRDTVQPWGGFPCLKLSKTRETVSKHIVDTRDVMSSEQDVMRHRCNGEAANQPHDKRVLGCLGVDDGNDLDVVTKEHDYLVGHERTPQQG
jgi:hypothetical protein